MNARLNLSSTRKGSESGDPVKYEPQTDSGAQLLKQDKAATATTPPKKRKWRTMQTARKRESKPAADPGSETWDSEPDFREARLSKGRKGLSKRRKVATATTIIDFA